jgi:cold-inducible RNA-binding protein
VPCLAHSDPHPQLRIEENVISQKIFVGNLSYETTQTDLESLFSEAGDITEVFLPVDRNTGRPRGFAFVEFADEAAVPIAIEKFNEEELKGRTLRVKEAEERQRRAPRVFSDGEGGGGFNRHAADKRPKPKGSRRNVRGRKRSL